MKDDPESFSLSIQIRDFLKMAGWNPPEPISIPPTSVERFSKYPSTMGAGGQPAGVTLVTWAFTQEEFAAVGNRDANTALNALSNALGDSLGGIAGSANSETAPANGIIRIVVGSKP